MSSYLLDTHIWLWSLVDPQKLKLKIRKELENPQNELWLSPISIWEALLLGEKGRIKMTPDPVRWVRAALKNTPFQEATLNGEVAFASRSIQWTHADPADCFLVATALVFDLTLITADRNIWKYPGVKCLKNS